MEDVRYLLLRCDSEDTAFRLTSCHFADLTPGKQVIVWHDVAVNFAEDFESDVEVAEDHDWCVAALAEGHVFLGETYDSAPEAEDLKEGESVKENPNKTERKGGRPPRKTNA